MMRAGSPQTLMDWKTAAVAVAIVIIVASVVRMHRSEVDVCREVFQGLVHGRQAVQGRIAWDRLDALGVDVGGTYRQMRTDRDRARYRKLFVEHFRKGFAGSGARANQFVNWRVAQQSPQDTVVAVDYPAKQKTLLLTLTAGKPRQVAGIRWSEQ